MTTRTAHIASLLCLVYALLLNNCNELCNNTSVALAQINAPSPRSCSGCLSLKDDQEIPLTDKTDSASGNTVPGSTQSHYTCQGTETRLVADEFMEQLEEASGLVSSRFSRQASPIRAHIDPRDQLLATQY